MAGTGRKLSGIYIPIGLDTQAINQDMSTLRNDFTNLSRSISQSLDAAVNPRTLIANFGKMTQALGGLRDAAKALEHLKPFGDFDKALQFMTPELQSIAKMMGITEEAQKKLMQSMARQTVVKQEVDSLRQLERTMGLTRAETLKLAQSLGMVVSRSAQKMYLGGELEKTLPLIVRVGKEYKELARAAGERITGKGFQDFFDTYKIKEAVDAFQKLHPQVKMTWREYQQLAQQAGVSVDQVKAYINSLEAKNRDAAKSISPLVQEYRQLAKLSGTAVTIQGFKEFRDFRNIQASVEAFKNLHNVSQITVQDYAQIARAAGVTTDQVARFIQQSQKTRDLTPIVSQLAENYRRLAQAAGQQISQADFSRFQNWQNISRAVNAFKQLNPEIKLTRQYYEQIARAAGVATSQVEKFIRAQQGMNTRGLFSFFSSGFQQALAGAGVITGMYGVVELMKSMSKAALQMENIKLGFQSIYGSAEIAANKLEYVKKISNDLGLSFVNTAEGAKKMFAAAKGTEVEADVENIFYSFSTMGAALKLTGDQMNSVFLALSQSINKGRLTAEEMRQQLAERMPGAIQLLAKSMGVTTQELDKMFQDGTVGLKNLIGFAEEVRRTYEAGARAASTGLQAELNRVSTAWFELKSAFVDTDQSAELVRKLGDAMRWLTSHADSISKVVKEIAKFALITGGVYAAATAIRSLTVSVTALWGAIKSGSLASFLAAFGPAGAGIGAASLAIGGLVYGLMSLADTATENDRLVQNMSGQFFDLERSIRDVSGATEDLQQKAKNLELQSLENKVREVISNFQGMFEHNEIQIEIPDEVIEGVDSVALQQANALDKLFADLTNELKDKGKGELGAAFEEQARILSEQFLNGVKTNLSKDKLNSLYLDLANSFESLRGEINNIGDNGNAARAYDALKNALAGMAKQLLDAKTAQLDYNKSSAESVKVLQQSNAAYAAIAKLAAASDVGKENKMAAGIKATASELVSLYKIAGEAQVGMEGLDLSLENSADKALEFRQEIQNFETSLPLVASLAIKNGTDFDTLAASLEQAAIQAGFTQQKIMELKAALNAAFNMEIGKSIEQKLQQLDTKIALAGAKTAQTTAYNILSTGITDEATKTRLAAASRKGDVQEMRNIYKELGRDIELVDQAWKKSEVFGAASSKGGGGARRRSGAASKVKSAREQMTEFAKEIGNVEKKLASLKAKYDDDPSIKYWADVTGELKKIDHILETGAGTEAEKKKLSELRDEYEKYAKLRKQQMADEERRQRTIDAANKLGMSYGQLGDVDGTKNGLMQVNAFKAQAFNMEKEWKEALAHNIISQEQFNAGIENLYRELNIKVEAASGSMVANFTDKLTTEADKLKDWQSEVSDLFVSSIGTMSDAFAEFFITGIQNTDDLAKAFKNMVSSMIKSLAQLFMKMIIMNTVSNLFGGLFGGSGGAAKQTVGPSQGGFTTSNVVVGKYNYAKGGLLAGGNISSYSGSVVNSPTVFSFGSMPKFARGVGLMGEAGPEFVMPAERGPGGKLGVRAFGGNGGQVEMNQAISIQIINNSDSQVSAKKRTDSSGNVDIQVMVEKMVADSLTRAGSAPFKAMQNVWQGQTALADR